MQTFSFTPMQSNINDCKLTIKCQKKLVVIDEPIIMGIVNTTPDSFFSDSRKANVIDAINTIKTMIDDGATIIDIGGQSTKPGANTVSVEEEIDRVIPLIELATKQFPNTILSIDTYYAEVAKAAVAAGASIVNDVSGGTMDEAMIETVGNLGVPYICTHIQGTPKTMQQSPTYKHVVNDLLDFFFSKIDSCKKAGITDIILDVGFGFGKTIEQNYQLLRSLSAFKMLEKPLLVGVSRKGMVYKPLEITPEEALNGTTVLHTLAILNGANILRVHDVKEAKQVVKLLSLYQ